MEAYYRKIKGLIMRIIVYLGHPAQYHFFKNIVNNLKKNHDIRYLIKKKDVLEDLLINDNIEFKNILPSGRKSTRAGIIWGLFNREFQVFFEALKFRPNLMIGGDPSIAHIGWILKIPILTILEDDVHVIKDLAKITFPFSTHIIAPDSCDCGRWNFKKISYAGYMKLAYLHPNYFDCEEIGSAKTALIRLSSLTAYHDTGVTGFDGNTLKAVTERLIGKYQLFISAEGELDPVYREYLLKINPNDLHKILCKSAIIISDSQSMTMEAAMLGIPSVRYNDFAGLIGVLEELEHEYGLTYGIKTSEPEKLYGKIEELLNTPDLKQEWQKRRARMLADKIDVTAFMVWFIEHYPESAEIMKKNPDYQYRFR